MWTGSARACPLCGTAEAPDFVFCHLCGTALPPAGWSPAPYALPRPPRPPLYRTRRGVAATAAALLTLWAPFVSALGAVLLSAGSTYLFVDRGRAGPRHRRAVTAAYGLLWLAAVLYGVAFVGFLGDAYGAWTRGANLASLRGSAEWFTWFTTVPTLVLVAALALQAWGLAPPALRPHLAGACGLLGALVLGATALAAADLPATMGPVRITVASVSHVLNRISLYRLVEGPGFLWLAYAYGRVHAALGMGPVPGSRAPAAAD